MHFPLGWATFERPQYPKPRGPDAVRFEHRGSPDPGPRRGRSVWFIIEGMAQFRYMRAAAIRESNPAAVGPYPYPRESRSNAIRPADQTFLYE